MVNSSINKVHSPSIAHAFANACSLQSPCILHVFQLVVVVVVDNKDEAFALAKHGLVPMTLSFVRLFLPHVLGQTLEVFVLEVLSHWG